jgi:dihydropteroate synthase
MGILNVTPDSFYAGSRLQDNDEILDRASAMIRDGADILDIGGYSTRPGAEMVSPEEETSRVVNAIQLLTQRHPDVHISVDTFRSVVARKAVEAGAAMVNDVSGGEMDQAMFETVADLRVPYILMHMRGTPQTMSTMTLYDNLLKSVADYFHQKIDQLRRLGVHDVIIDPGFGFAKTPEQNFELLRRLSYFTIFELPILVGLSRKSMIWKTLETNADNALNGTTALHMLALTNGARLLRVHDVREARECIALFQKTQPLHV